MDMCIEGKHGRISFSSSKCSFSFRVFFCSYGNCRSLIGKGSVRIIRGVFFRCFWDFFLMDIYRVRS